MADNIETIGLRLRADGLVETAAGFTLSGKAAEAMGQKLSATGKVVDQYGNTSRATAAAMRGLPAQFGDLVTQIAGGQQVWLALLQQGTQVKDMFGGMRPMMAALAGLVTPTVVAFTGLAAAVGTVALAYYQGAQESRALVNGLALSGNTAAVTEGQFNGLVASLATAKNAAAGNVRELLQVLATSGGQTSSTLQASGRAALALARLNGQSAADNARGFAAMGDSVTDWAAKANKAYNYLTAEQYKQIMALEAQGRASEAVRLNMDALAGTLESRTAPSLGVMDRALQSTTNWLSRMWDAAKGVGREETIGDRIAKLRERLAGWTDSPGGLPQGGGAKAALEQELEELQRGEARKSILAADRAAAQEAEQEKLLKASRQFKDSELAIESATAGKLLAEQQASLTRRRVTADQAYQRDEISALTYRDRIWAIEREKLAAEEAAAQSSIAIEKNRVVKTTLETNNRTAAVRTAEAKLVALRGQRAQLEADLRSGNYDPKTHAGLDDAQTNFRRSELQNDGYAQAAQAMRDSQTTSMQAAHDLLATNKGLNTDLIKNDRERGMAQIAAEAETLRQRLDMQAGSAADRQMKEDALANWIVLRQRKLADDLKPEWQKMLEGWQDTTKLMADSSNTMFTGFLRDGEDAYVQLMTKGTISIKGLVQNMLAEMARVQFRQFAAKSGGSLLGMVGSVLNAFSGGGGAGSVSSVSYGDNIDWGAMINAGGNHLGGLGTEPSFNRLVPASTFAGAPRAHTGIGPGELPAIIKQDEGVFTKGQMKALAPVDQVAKAGAGTRINFAPVINVDASADKAQVMQIVQQGMRQAQRELLDMMDRRQA